MQLCFIDEAGDLGVLRDPPAPNDQPVLVVAGLFVDAARLVSLTHEYLDLKYRFFPGLNYSSTRRLDRILPEIKGSEIRKQLKQLQHRYYDVGTSRHVGGVVVSDNVNHRSGALMFSGQ